MGAVLRGTRAAVLVLVAVLAVVVHHEIVAPMAHAPAARTVAAAPAGERTGVTDAVGMDHRSAPLIGASDSVAMDLDGACAGVGTHHCTAAGVDTVKPVPPTEAAVGDAPAVPSHAVAGRDVPGTVGRAPPDLSLLSRLLL
ncbi:hypothetical protein NGF19_15365 [Streptomyces sp. RY43-2]|uniref:Secreted protein n=1 Tax=Streptomyces macrolidinus TaxID=2952607 RepID=A0ABT0ZF09_9ACTN|nr:hypothetical protein [Streptomyces macrolidinus]MCN9242152.1 hypothetical protein [Streptomyces macrolidinus]